MARPTIADVAGLSGVSVATVDRVLNGRAPVKGDTARKVLAAAETLDVHATALLRKRLEAPPAEKTLAFLLQKGSHSFYHALGQAPDPGDPRGDGDPRASPGAIYRRHSNFSASRQTSPASMSRVGASKG